MNIIGKPLTLSISIASCLAFSLTSNASSLDSSAKVEQSIITDAQNSQKIISSSSDKSFELQNEIDALTAEISGLEVYQQHLTTLIASQNSEMASLEQQQHTIVETRQSIVPLMYSMLQGLQSYIEQDMPIRKQARLQRVAALKALMSESNISDSEKYRRILEAYQIELDYVNKLGLYTSAIEIDGETREIEQLYLGHLSLVSRSLDKQNYWYWDQNQNQWELLDASLNIQLEKAFMVANKELTPTLLTLPLSANRSVVGETAQ